MPIPFLLGAVAVIAGAVGVITGIDGMSKMSDAKDKVDRAKARHERNLQKFNDLNGETTRIMDDLGKRELMALKSFKVFSSSIEKIQNKPEFKSINIEGKPMDPYTPEELKKVSVGAEILLGGMGGAAAGTAGGFAAAGATTSAVMALGTASTGTAIASLSGAAATNATLAVLGGGTLAAGGGGVGLGTTLLGASTFGVGLMVGGIIFSFVGSHLSEQADQAWDEMLKAEKSINKVCVYLGDLKTYSEKFRANFNVIYYTYRDHLDRLEAIVEGKEKINWLDLNEREKQEIKNTILLVGLVYQMCKVKLVNIRKVQKDTIHIVGSKVLTAAATEAAKENQDESLNEVNKAEINETFAHVKSELGNMGGDSIKEAYKAFKL